MKPSIKNSRRLIDIALEATKKTYPTTNEHIELALAFARGEVTHIAVVKALTLQGRLDKNMNHWLGKVLKYAIRSNKIKIILTF